MFEILVVPKMSLKKFTKFMNAFEQKFVIKFLFLSGKGYKAIYTELKNTLQENIVSLSTVKRLCQKFKTGDLTCLSEDIPGRPKSDLVGPITKILEKYPFSSAKSISRKLNVTRQTISRVLKDDMGLRKYVRKWVPHELTVEQKEERVQRSIEILEILKKAAKKNFINIMTGDESWFYLKYESSFMYSSSPEKVPHRTSMTISSEKFMVTMFFNGNSLLCCDILPKGHKYNQRYFIDHIIPEIQLNTDEIEDEPDLENMMIHMDNCRVHKGKLVTKKLKDLKVKSVPHPPYSPDISPCDFWLFGRMKQYLADKEIKDEYDLKTCILSCWETVSFDELQNVFVEWIERLNWVIEHSGEYFIK